MAAAGTAEGASPVIFTQHYTIEHDVERDLFIIRSEEPPICPCCGAAMAGHGTRRRHMIDEEGVAHWLLLRRWRCPCCGSFHLELPAFLMPYRHYDAGLIREVQEGGGEYCPADDSTIRRWKRAAAPAALPGLPVQSDPGPIFLHSTGTKEDIP